MIANPPLWPQPAKLGPFLFCVLVCPMSEIMIRCPSLGTTIPTGLTTEKVKFKSLAGVQISLRCPACFKIQWDQKDAWVAKEE
jgi:hypothetical protein